MKVCEKVQSKGTTSYNEVADELVSEFTHSKSHLAAESVSRKYSLFSSNRGVLDFIVIKRGQWLLLSGSITSEHENCLTRRRQSVAAIVIIPATCTATPEDNVGLCC